MKLPVNYIIIFHSVGIFFIVQSVSYNFKNAVAERDRINSRLSILEMKFNNL